MGEGRVRRFRNSRQRAELGKACHLPIHMIQVSSQSDGPTRRQLIIPKGHAPSRHERKPHRWLQLAVQPALRETQLPSVGAVLYTVVLSRLDSS